MTRRQKLTYDDHKKIAGLLSMSMDNIFLALKIAEKAYGVSNYSVKMMFKVLSPGGLIEKARSAMDDNFHMDGYGNMPNPYYSPEVRGETKEKLS